MVDRNEEVQIPLPQKRAKPLALCSAQPKKHFEAGSSRIGTIYAEFKELCGILGKPRIYHPGDQDDKVTYEWEIETPRGRAFLYDYWWNRDGEWSIGARDPRVCRWVARYLRALGAELLESAEGCASYPRINK